VSCKDIADWLHRDAQSLDEAQRLVLDDHLATCAQCSGDRARMQLVRGLGHALPVPPAGAREYSRAIAKALLEGKREDRAKPRRVKWIAPVIAFAGVASAATVAGVVATRDDDVIEAPRAPAPALPSEAPSEPTQTEPKPTEPAPPEPSRAPARKPTVTPAHRESAAELLERARKEFATKAFDDAERTAKLALAAKPTHALAGEIHMLLAEIAQGAGKPDVAVERYTAVADTFKGTAAAESALYAAARVELKRRDTAAARALLDRYLARYPTGRYADDARRELEAIH
jgi:hypothetical protein